MSKIVIEGFWLDFDHLLQTPNPFLTVNKLLVLFISAQVINKSTITATHTALLNTAICEQHITNIDTQCVCWGRVF